MKQISTDLHEVIFVNLENIIGGKSEFQKDKGSMLQFL